MSISQQHAALSSGQSSARALAEAALASAQQHVGLNALITVTAGQALARAEQLDRAGDFTHPLAGIPCAHKDLFCTTGVLTSCGSKMLANFVPPYSATIVEKLAEAGAVSIGKTNMDEFAMGSSNESSYFGPVRNPWDLTRVPGGSSGGSAALVAARVLSFATASDTGGSIRQPAAFCGVTGLKPSYGRVSRYGMVAFASSLDQAGVIATSAEDCAEVLQVMAGFDPRDATSVDIEVPNYRAELAQAPANLRIGIPRFAFAEGLDSGVRNATQSALRVFEQMGATLVDIDLAHAEAAIPAYYVIAPCEASSNLARFDGVRYGHRCADPSSLIDVYERSRAEGFGAEVQRRILIGSYALSAGYFDAYYLRAQRVRRLIAQGFAQAFASVDLIAMPTTPSVAFKLGEKSADPLSLYLADVYTVAVNLAGLPAISVPAGFSDGLPVGLQLIGPGFSESRILAAAHAFQLRTDWHLQAPNASAANSGTQS